MLDIRHILTIAFIILKLIRVLLHRGGKGA